MYKWRVSEEWLVFPFFLMIFWSELPGFRSNFHICRLGVLQNSTILVGGFNHLYESQWEGLSHFFLENKKCLKPQTSHSIPITSLSISHCPPNLPYIIWSAVCSLFRVSISYLSTNHKSVWMCCKYAQRYNCIKPFSYPQTSDAQSWSVHDAWFRLMPQSLLWTFSVPNATGKHIPTPWPVADSPKNSVILFSWLTVPQWNRPGV